MSTPIYDQLMGELLTDPVKLAAEIREELAALARSRVLAEDGSVLTDQADAQVGAPPTVEMPAVTSPEGEGHV